MQALRTPALALFLTALGGVGWAAAPPAPDAARVGVLVRQLDDDRFRVRERADRALQKCGKAVVPLLRAELARARSPEVRSRLNNILKVLTADERVPDLVRLLGDSQNDNRERADYELRRYGKAVVPLLKKQLADRPLAPEHRQRVERIIADLTPR
jgi:hypothetical protein